MDISQCSDCSIRVIVLLLIIHQKIYLLNILNLSGVLNLRNKINIDAISMGFAYKTEIF